MGSLNVDNSEDEVCLTENNLEYASELSAFGEVDAVPEKHRVSTS